jgi:hypothetical protein
VHDSLFRGLVDLADGLREELARGVAVAFSMAARSLRTWVLSCETLRRVAGPVA